MKVIEIPKGDKEARQHKKNRHADVKFQEEALQRVRETFIKSVFVMRNEHQVSRQRAYPRQGRYII